MRIVIILLVGVLAALQYRLWFGKNSLPDYWRLQQEVQHQRKANDNLARRNEVLYADIKDLREGEDALEERARNELGMIKKEAGCKASNLSNLLRSNLNQYSLTRSLRFSVPLKCNAFSLLLTQRLSTYIRTGLRRLKRFPAASRALNLC